MDPRVLEILSHQQEKRFAGLAGSELRATIRISEELLNQALPRLLPTSGAVRSIAIQPHAANRVSVRLSLAAPGFIPPLTIGFQIERQPDLPNDPVLALRLTGSASMLRLAAPIVTSFRVLPAGVRMSGDRILIDVRTLMQQHGWTSILDYVEQLHVTTEEGAIVLIGFARVPKMTAL